MTSKTPTVSETQIESKILLIRGQRIMLDADLAELCGVQTKVLMGKPRWSQIVTTYGTINQRRSRSFSLE